MDFPVPAWRGDFKPREEISVEIGNVRGYTRFMVPIRIIDRRAQTRDEDRAFWLTKTPEERIAAVEFLRQQCFYATGQTGEPRMEKILRLLPRRA